MEEASSKRTAYALPWLRRLAPPLLSTGIALGVRFAIAPWAGDGLPYLTFFPAVAFAGYFGGLRAGILTALLGGLLADYYFMAPRLSLRLEGTNEWIGLAGYLVGSSAICALIHSRTSAMRKERDSFATRAKFASIIASAMDAIITVDATHRVLAFNRAAEQTFGCPAAEALGQPLDRFIPQRFREAHRRHVAAFGETGVTSRNMYRPGTLWGLRGNGEEFPIEATISQVEADGQRLFTVILRDITERLRTEEALRASQERLELAQEAAAMGTWEWNVGTGKVIWSDQTCVLHGIPPGTFDGRFESWLGTVYPEDRELASGAAAAALAAKSPYSIEYRSLLPDGTVTWTSARGQVVCDAEDRPARMVGVCMDVTERKHAEELRRQSERLAAAGQMAATVAHEINNPLAAVVNLWYLLGKEPLTAAAKEYMALAGKELERVVHIAQQTLAFYRDSQPAPVELRALLNDVVAPLQSSGPSATRIVVEPGTPCEVSGYGRELQQLLSNLVRNALEAESRNVRIRLAAGHDWKEGRRQGVHLIVADDGKGIPRDKLRSIFEPFYTTKGSKGTGLGLWVSRGIIARHEGRIKVRSNTQPGRSGTIFSAFLPSTLSKKRAGAGARPEAARSIGLG
jgi:PAS domain S-box-containing protein